MIKNLIVKFRLRSQH